MNPSPIPTLSFEDGDAMPILGLGTWKSRPDEVYEAVKVAVRVGYRHIDCAAIYGNETEVGRALAESFEEGVVSRDEMWITSKLWNDSHAREDVRPALAQTLEDLNLDYLDLYLIHWPVALRKDVGLPASGDDFLSLEERPLSETWQGMEEVKDGDLTRHIGVSNFSTAKLASLMDRTDEPPEANQVELHPYLQQPDLLDFCEEAGILVTAYSPLGSGDRPDRLKEEDEPVLLEDPVIGEIAARHDATPAQVLLAWAIQRGTSVIPKSVTPSRIRENLAAAELSLDAGDVEAIAELDRERRYVQGDVWTMDGSPYTQDGLWDE